MADSSRQAELTRMINHRFKHKRDLFRFLTQVQVSKLSPEPTPLSCEELLPSKRVRLLSQVFARHFQGEEEVPQVLPSDSDIHPQVA